MKSLQRLPGVQSSGDGTAGIFVRGGNYDQNLITLDGSTLYNGEHLKGFVSAVNSEMVDNVVLYKGAFPARYGSRLIFRSHSAAIAQKRLRQQEGNGAVCQDEFL